MRATLAKLAPVLVGVIVTLVVNRVQLILWSPGCRDVLIAGQRTVASPSCATPHAGDVPLFWLAPLLGLALAIAIAGRRHTGARHPASPARPE